MRNKYIENSRRVAFLLTTVGGILEIYSYLEKGGIFATAITGNIVLMVYNIKNLNFINIDRYIFPIFTFCLGVSLVEIINNNNYFNIRNLNWKSLVLILEILVMIVIPYILSDKLSVSLIAFISAIQIQTFRKIYDDIYMSTVCTGNTRSLIDAIINKNFSKAKNYAIAISGFLLGVILGDFGVIFLKTKAIYIAIPIIVLTLLIINRKDKNEVIR